MICSRSLRLACCARIRRRWTRRARRPGGGKMFGVGPVRIRKRKRSCRKRKEGGRLTGAGGAAEMALQEEASGSSDLALVYVVCAVLFAVLAAVLVWAYNNLL